MRNLCFLCFLVFHMFTHLSLSAKRDGNEKKICTYIANGNGRRRGKKRQEREYYDWGSLKEEFISIN